MSVLVVPHATQCFGRPGLDCKGAASSPWLSIVQSQRRGRIPACARGLTWAIASAPLLYGEYVRPLETCTASVLQLTGEARVKLSRSSQRFKTTSVVATFFASNATRACRSRLGIIQPRWATIPFAARPQLNIIQFTTKNYSYQQPLLSRAFAPP